MKNLIIILMMFIVGCSDAPEPQRSDATIQAPVTVPESPPEPPKEQPIEPEELTEPGALPVLFSVISYGKLYFYDGELKAQENIAPKKCGDRCFLDGEKAVKYDEYGEVVEQKTVGTPDLIIDDWSIVRIDPATAYALGGLPKDYTKVFFQGVEVGKWYLNQWFCSDLVRTVSGDYVAIDRNGSAHPLNTEIENINHADKLLIYNFDPIGRTALIESDSVFSVSWFHNYFNQAKEWLFFDGVWYSQNGYELGADLVENANALYNWNTVYPFGLSEAPILIGAGVYDSALYWIECNAGFLVKYLPESDTIETAGRLYQGDGTRESGFVQKGVLDPVIIDGVLYYNESGSIWKLELETGIVELFFAGYGEVVKW